MTRIIKGDSEIPVTIMVDNGVTIGQSPRLERFGVLITEASQESKSAPRVIAARLLANL